jgi:acyl carrier protein
MLSNMSHSQYMAAVAPKVAGSINVAANLPPKDLDFFVLLSSSAAIIGNRGQANYSAANAFLDAYAKHLTARGYPATSISLGSVLSVGWVAENSDRLPIALSYGTIAEDRLLSILEYHMDPRWGAAKDVNTCHTIAGLRSAVAFERNGIPLPAFMSYPLFSHLRVSVGRAKSDEADADIPISESLKNATSKEDAFDVATKAIVSKVSRVMAISPSDIECQRTLASYGVDSLVTVDLKTWFKRELGATIPTQHIVGALTINDLAAEVLEISTLLK